MPEFGLLLAGVLIATAVMAVGIGGGILWTPLLILVYGLSPQEAIATSLFIQVVGMGSGTFAYARAKMVEKKLSLTLFLVALPGVIIGSFITVSLDPQTIKLALGTMAMLLAVLFVASGADINQVTSYRFNRQKVMQILPIPAFFGFIMGTLSLGISEWLIPALRNRLNLEMARSIGTVVPVMFLLALTASIIHWSFAKELHIDLLVWGGIGTLIGGQLGAHISRRLNERVLKQSFIYLMTLIGIHLIFQAI